MKTETEADGDGDGDGGKVIPTGFFASFEIAFLPPYLSFSSSNLNDSMLAVQLCMKNSDTTSSTMRHK